MPTSKRPLSRRALLHHAPAALTAAQLAAQPAAPVPGTRIPVIIRPASVSLSEQKRLQSIPIPKQSGRGVLLMRDQRLKVINPKGKQVGDLFAFASHSAEEFIAPAFTMTRNRNIYLQVGKGLLSNYGNALLVLEEDTSGRNDLLYPACSGGQKPGLPASIPNCRDNMQAALRAINFPVPNHPEIVHPHNLFQNSPVIDLDGNIEVREPVAKAGDYVILRALENVVVVVTACSSPSVVNAKEPKELLMEVYG
ncbi:MAG: urea carboxylase-associated family protein [Acidobacteria bacterium]|jgi:uncharacterized protein YcgI (DUF1989 family)|nr:urea carboxylase-associated family protein [Acidobacteriota bacterium]